jgi:hypothetical protein
MTEAYMGIQTQVLQNRRMTFHHRANKYGLFEGQHRGIWLKLMIG